MKDKIERFRVLLSQTTEIVEGPADRDEKLQSVCQLLRDGVEYYNWVGFYVVDPLQSELILGPFVGEPTEHVTIPFDSGICGQAAQRRETFTVQDVSKEVNYLSCSPRVRSEIVVPLLKDAEIVAGLDIDSHMVSPFEQEDVDFLEHIGRMVSELF
jgi:L-methionine (R)-S-oxide reductase